MSDWKRNAEQLLADCGVIEVRALGPSTLVGQFDSLDAIRQAVKPIKPTHSIYSTLNRPASPTVSNQLAPGRALSDGDIQSYQRLLFDFDPERPKGYNATEEECDLAKERVFDLRHYLTSQGWPEPLMAFSGNGYHLQYRIKLTNSQAHRDQLKVIYRGLADKFGDDVVSFDTTTRNPSRICRLYGTVNRKAPPLPDRPQRVAGCYIPRDWNCVPHSRFRALAERLKPAINPARPTIAPARPDAVGYGSGDYSTLDAVSWFQSHGLLHAQREAGMWAVICPWHHEHTSESPPDHADTILWERGYNDWPTFHCKHAHCDGRGIRDVMVALGDPDRFCGRVFGGAA